MMNHVGSSTAEAEALKRFVYMYFAAHDIMGRTAFEDRWEGVPITKWLENDDMEEASA
jgi:DMSO/TMAO reductase YedYZ molybdopterin-dependent catalytic subunit